MIDKEKLLEAIHDRFGVASEQLRSRSGMKRYSYPRKIICHILRRQRDDAVELTNRSHEVVRTWCVEMSWLADHDSEVAADIEAITKAISPTMTIELKESQVRSLYEVLEHFLVRERESDLDRIVIIRLICLHIDDILEKCRKRIKSGKKNLNLDEKEQHAFLVWYFYYGASYERVHPHGYMTLIDIINQLKPINDAKKITSGH